MGQIRKSARGRQCTIRLPKICNFNPETVVLCHLGGAGWALKSHDIHGAYGCSACHQAVDGASTRQFTKDYLRLAFYEGMVRTQKILLDSGLILTGDE